MEQLLPEIPRIYTALAEWAACMMLAAVFYNRISGWRLGAAAVLSLLTQTGLQLLAGRLPLGFWIPTMFAAVFLMFFWLRWLCDLSTGDVIYICVRAFVLAEFAASLGWQVVCYLVVQHGGRPGWGVELPVMLTVYVLVFFAGYRLEIRFVPEDRHINIRTKELVSAYIIGLVAFVMSNIGFVYSNTPFSARFDLEMFLVRTIVDFGGLAVLYAHYILNAELREKQELDAIRNVLQRQYALYELFHNNSYLLNLKYHDLKHQIEVIRAEKDADKKESYLSELETHLKIYEAQNDTGNKVLDTILGSKRLSCAEKGIELTCVINGKLLDFMDAMDICTIFGNALDNAIECEMLIAEKEKRMIHATVFAKNNLLMIRFENYFEGELKKLESGLPVTTKKETEYHGYGLKSIKYSAAKYGGAVTINKHNNWFELKILLPLNNQKSGSRFS